MRSRIPLIFLSATLWGGSYRIETLSLPPKMDPEVSGIAFTAQGTLVAVNRRGQIWMRNQEDRWRLFAAGLHEPLGVIADSESVVYVMQRPELTRVTDGDGDGRAERFETLSDAFGLTNNYHEFSYGLSRDGEGNFVASLGSVSTGEIGLVRGALNEQSVWRGVIEAHRSIVPYRGWIFKVTPAGEFIPWATGFRQPVGFGYSPDGELFATDSQGNFVPTSPLHHVRKGRFYGSPDGLKWTADYRGERLTEDELWQRRTPPAVSFPHGVMGGSPGQPVWDTTQGKFGPFQKQIFLGDITQLISRVFLEKVGGEYQGVVFPFLRGSGGRTASLTTPESKAWAAANAPAGTPVSPTGDVLGQGCMRLAFSPDGKLYLGETVRGWAPGHGGIQRVVWTGEVPVEMLSIEIRQNGFAVHFTVAMDSAVAAKPASYHLRRFRYAYHASYGSAQIDGAAVPVKAVRLAANKRTAELEIGTLEPGFIYEFKTGALRSANGRPLENPLAFYTLNRLSSGEAYQGPRPIVVDDVEVADYTPDPTNGRAVYGTFCVGCHQADGRGVPGGAANLADDPTRLAKSDDVLLKSISEGNEVKGMPPFRGTLTERQRRDVLAYVRSAFGAKNPTIE